MTPKEKDKCDHLLRSRTGAVLARAGTTRGAEEALDSQAPPERAGEVRDVVSSNLSAVHDCGGHLPSVGQRTLGSKIASACWRAKRTERPGKSDRGAKYAHKSRSAAGIQFKRCVLSCSTRGSSGSLSRGCGGTPGIPGVLPVRNARIPRATCAYRPR